MPKETKEYRSKARIYADILDSIMKSGGKSGPTHILLGANLSYDRLTKHLGQLVELGLVTEELEGEDRVYKVTSKGAHFASEFSRFVSFAEAFGIGI
jgi:predicted transcriptional regulator